MHPGLNDLGDRLAALPGFARLHPMQDDADMQGALRLLYETRRFLEVIAGLDEASLQPAAGAHGEYTALKVIRAYFKANGQAQRTKVLSPSNAHGTNPASCAMCGADVITVDASDGYTNLDDLRRLIDQEGPVQRIDALEDQQRRELLRRVSQRGQEELRALRFGIIAVVRVVIFVIEQIAEQAAARGCFDGRIGNPAYGIRAIAFRWLWRLRLELHEAAVVQRNQHPRQLALPLLDALGVH